MGLLGGIGKAIGSIGGSIPIPGGGTLTGSINPNAGGGGSYSIQKRVKDAQKAGIHPLYAMNAPVYTNFGKPQGAVSARADIPGQRSPHADKTSELLDAQIEGEKANTNLTNARAAALVAEQKNDILPAEQTYQPGQITAQRVDPSFTRNSAGRLTSFRDATGKWHTVDQNVTPQDILEGEYGESAELQGIARAIKGAYGYGGVGNLPSARDIVNFFFGRQ